MSPGGCSNTLHPGGREAARLSLNHPSWSLDTGAGRQGERPVVSLSVCAARASTGISPEQCQPFEWRGKSTWLTYIIFFHSQNWNSPRFSVYTTVRQACCTCRVGKPPRQAPPAAGGISSRISRCELFTSQGHTPAPTIVILQFPAAPCACCSVGCKEALRPQGPPQGSASETP